MMLHGQLGAQLPPHRAVRRGYLTSSQSVVASVISTAQRVHSRTSMPAIKRGPSSSKAPPSRGTLKNSVGGDNGRAERVPKREQLSRPQVLQRVPATHSTQGQHQTWRASTIAHCASNTFGSFTSALAGPASVLDLTLKYVRGAHSGLPANVPADAPEKPRKLTRDGGQRPDKHKQHERQQAILTNKKNSMAQGFRAYLNPLGYLETHYTRMMSSLSSIAYRMDRVTPRYLKRMHGVELRYSSLACERSLVAPQPDAHLEILNYGDGMAASADVLERSDPTLAPSRPDTLAAASAAAHAFDHFYSMLQGDASERAGQLEGYTVWRPRHRAPAANPTALAGPSTPGNLPSPHHLDAAIADFTDGTQFSLPLIHGGSPAAEEWEPKWELASIERAASFLSSSSASSLTSFDSDDTPLPIHPPDVDGGTEGELLGVIDTSGADNVEGGMEGDLMHAAATSVLAPGEQTPSARGYIEAIRERLLAASTVRTVTAAAAAGVREEEEARHLPRPRLPKPDGRDVDGHLCPVHWFVADDDVTGIRYFSLQGSDSIESWRTNLSFDPVTFEDPELGVQVHRGMYSAALALYPRFAAIATEHLHSSPYARVSFTGHSLGGSIATVLALMLIHRGVLRAPQLGLIYTFGAAACFCEHREVPLAYPIPPSEPAFEATEHGQRVSTSVQSSDSGDSHSFILRRLGVPQDTIRNVILTHDIVPRAFGCDYKPVAAMLRQLFTAHQGLQRDERSIMYHFLGRLCVLQPDAAVTWVHGDESKHPLLPSGPGLYELVEPDMMSRTHSLALASMDAFESLFDDVSDASVAAAAACGGADGFMPSSRRARRRADVDVASGRSRGSAVEGYPAPSAPPVAASAALHRHAFFQSLAGLRAIADAVPPRNPFAPDAPNPSSLSVDHEATLGPDLASLLPRPRATPHAQFRRPRASLRQAELAMLDSPHPIEVLSSASAYGSTGSISRFHHPDHYTQGLGSVVRTHLAPLRSAHAHIDLEHFTGLLKSRLRRMQNDPAAAWHHAVWELQAASTGVGQRLPLSPEAGTAFGAKLLAKGSPTVRKRDATVMVAAEVPTWDGTSAGAL